jgi:hypothetical protein
MNSNSLWSKAVVVASRCRATAANVISARRGPGREKGRLRLPDVASDSASVSNFPCIEWWRGPGGLGSSYSSILLLQPEQGMKGKKRRDGR